MKRRSPIHAYKRLLAKDRDWDWYFLLALERKKIERMRNYMEENRLHTGWQQNVRDMNICIKLINIITDEDAVYKSWLNRNYEPGNNKDLRELFSQDRPIESFPIYVNSKNEHRFFRAKLILDAQKENKEKSIQLLIPELRKQKALHLYHLIREYKLFQWWD